MDSEGKAVHPDYISEYKRHGHFDNQRKRLVADFKPLDAQLAPLLLDLVLVMAQRDPSIVTKNNNRLSAMVQAKLLAKADTKLPTSTFSEPSLATSETADPLLERERAIVGEIKTLISSHVASHVLSNETLLGSILAELQGPQTTNVPQQ